MDEDFAENFTADGFASFDEWWARQDELAAYESDHPTFSEMGIA